ncbi:FAD/NAD(P)-binding protein [Dyadobacter psychrotolerans]|uniref:FAD-dependent urate hydroxylase HpyO/Asp monooxygenase CreE-like FAD/NAD(P)-binding domain-containing protein n=1 Tax=Dyadobacter psychrotolerans TaxID=2541721 RepID=A0A4R5E0C0_9BACT|nr:FAD/NAD(P)-binding protein [Dyadobacter psychrotolerans]TDE18290.1 hypothetical protein E0F88_01750 [Dyadobacter psychrotolerans]
MTISKVKKRVAILGGGPSGLFIYKRLVESNPQNFEITIFETKKQLGAGMPYSQDGANVEHVTNVSDNEIPEIVTSIQDWIQTVPDDSLSKFNIDKNKFSEYRVLPRLLFGRYLSAQFDLLLSQAEKSALATKVCFDSNVTDIINKPDQHEVWVEIGGETIYKFDCIIICTGHKWPVKYEGSIPGYFDSPYPPAKLSFKADHPVALKGSSLTAIDAIRTLARRNGKFLKSETNKLSFQPNDDSLEFKIVMHSRNGLLPAIRFHLEEPQLSADSLLTQEQIVENMVQNEGFLSLDYVFEKDFKENFREKDPAFYNQIKDQGIEDFVGAMMDFREKKDPFQLFKAEYAEAEQSIKRKESIYWKEVLAVLSFAMNYPAKYLSAEDMKRLQKVLMPLISVVIAFVPQSSCEELLALYDAGKLEIISVGEDSNVEPQKDGGIIYNYADENDQPLSVYYKTFVDCVGQPHLSFEDFPFSDLIRSGRISPARLKFKSVTEGEIALAKDSKNVEASEDGAIYLKVPGLTINDDFEVIDQSGNADNRIYIMAVPYIGGFNPDYSGLDFCEEASSRIVESIISNLS